MAWLLKTSYRAASSLTFLSFLLCHWFYCGTRLLFLKKTMILNRKRIFAYCGFMCIALLLGTITTSAAGTLTVKEKKGRIIDLFQSKLSQAYTFKGADRLPDFFTLDQIFPGWDGGDPGGGRRGWLEDHYLYQEAKYRVDSVFLTSQYTAKVRGKKSLVSTKRVEFLWWFHRTVDDQSIVPYEALVYRDADGDWKIKSITEL